MVPSLAARPTGLPRNYEPPFQRAVPTCMRALQVKRFVQGILFFLVPSFLVQPEGPFLCPNPQAAHAVARRSCQGWPSRQPLSKAPMFVRPCLDSSEHVSTLVLAGTTITRGARFLQRDENSCRILVSGGSRRPIPMMQSCASAAKLRGGGPILPRGMKAMWAPGWPPPRTVIGRPSRSCGTRQNCQA